MPFGRVSCGAYERYIYKTKLLKQVEGYENQAVTGYLKTLKIAGAYAIDDESVQQARQQLARLLFTIGRCKDLLCIEAFSTPPFPHDITEAEKEEYRGRFEEIGLRFQESAFETYKNILQFTDQRYTAGPFVTHAYVRLYQNSASEYGAAEERSIDSAITSGPEWKCNADSGVGWTALDYSDSGWAAAQLVTARGGPPLPASRRKTPRPLRAGVAAAGPGQQNLFPPCHHTCRHTARRPVLLLRDRTIVDFYQRSINSGRLRHCSRQGHHVGPDRKGAAGEKCSGSQNGRPAPARTE